MIGLSITMLADAPIIVDICAVILLFGDDIDDTGDGVGTVDGATAVIQDLNAIDGS